MENSDNGSSGASFTQFGKHFQECVVYALLTDKQWASAMVEVLSPSFFDLKYLQFLVDRYIGHARKYRDFPTLPMLVSIIRSDLLVSSDIVVRDQIIDYLQRMKSTLNPADVAYVKDRSLEFARKQALRAAIEKSIDLMATEKYETIVDVVKKAVSLGQVTSIGHDLHDDLEARFVATKRECIATGHKQLDRDDVFNGGVGGGELAAVIGATGSGKSHWLVDMGCAALRAKKNVAHYTFELSEINTGTRYDSNLCGIDANEVFSRKSDVIEWYSKHRSELGRLKIKEYPTSTVTVHTIRSHLERLSLTGFRPDLIIIDYADIMRSSRQFDSLRHELKLIYEELRGLAQELRLPVWTACFHGDTMISSPSGDFMIKDRVGQSGFPVYSYNAETRRIELRTVKNVYKSGECVEVWKVTLDNGNSVVVTPNHKFMRRDGTYCELRDLHVGDSLMPFDTRVSTGQMSGRKQVYRNDGTWEFVYKMVGEWKFGCWPKLHQIHHKDFDKTNDHPDNLELLTISEHYKIHSRVQWDPHIPCSLDHLRTVYSERMKIDNPMFDPLIRVKAGEHRRGKCVGDDNPMRCDENRRKVSEVIRSSEKFAEYKRTLPDRVKTIWSERTESERKLIGQKVQVTRFGSTREERIQKHVQIALEVSTYEEYVERTLEIPLSSGLKKQIWKNRNHKIVRIEPAGFADVYNMEVDELHNYALAAGIIVKNSQSNKEGATSDVIDVTNMSEAYGKAFVADIVVSVSRKAIEKSSGRGRLYIAKNRAGRDGFVYPIKIDTARSMFEITGENVSLEDSKEQDETEFKKSLKKKWDELQKDGSIRLTPSTNDKRR